MGGAGKDLGFRIQAAAGECCMMTRELKNKSSWIMKVEYDARAKVMRVSTKSGKRYAYQAVPAKLVDEFCAAESPGGFLNEKIVGRFEIELKKKGGKGVAAG